MSVSSGRSRTKTTAPPLSLPSQRCSLKRAQPFMPLRLFFVTEMPVRLFFVTEMPLRLLFCHRDVPGHIPHTQRRRFSRSAGH